MGNLGITAKPQPCAGDGRACLGVLVVTAAVGLVVALNQMSDNGDESDIVSPSLPAMADTKGTPEPPCPPGVDCEGHDDDDYDGYDFNDSQIQKIWNDPKMFGKWVKGESKMGLMNQNRAQQIVQNARRLDPNGTNGSLRVDINPRGVAGQEMRIKEPHFKIGPTHIYLKPGVTLQ